ncbi:MAG TPA: hypothetical protein PLE99_02630 [Candidatus Thiothrix moscowensis]|uniref:hypothetical protein n=1 Tax=unclassified Thiothrix TaxID=2636184 RepID=UPI0025E6D35B|nr:MULTISPECIES: hypothetical protein [unclassified Thiothrix]HRJ51637.1 hypothetical protein [Candidatus Thiothrix moscowensis]HRJ91952.1 hypothetical protein [Candidatus Thiothrix moscowensis]
MKNTNVFVFSSLLILGGCFGGSGGGNGLSVALSAENAATAAQLSMAAPKAVSGLLEGMIEDVPDDVFTDIEARTANREAGIATAMAPTREEEACSHGGKVIVEENDTTFTIILENCTETESVPATDSTPAYSSTDISNGSITFSDSTMDGYPDAEKVTITLSESFTDSTGKEENSAENGSFFTGYSDTGYAIKNMNINTHYWGKESSSSPAYDYTIAAQDFSVLVDGTTDQQTFSGIVTATGMDEAGDALLGGSFRIDTITPINNDQTQGEYKITGAGNTTVVTRLDPAGIYVEVNGASAEFHAWSDIGDYFD